MNAAWPGERPMLPTPPPPMPPWPAPTRDEPTPAPVPVPDGRLITVDVLPCGHIAGDLCDDECAYWAGVALGWYAPPEAYLTAGRAA